MTGASGRGALRTFVPLGSVSVEKPRARHSDAPFISTIGSAAASREACKQSGNQE